jgi:hypothetical protein
MRILSPLRSAWRGLQSKHGALRTPLGPVSLLLVVSTLAFAASVSDITGTGQTGVFSQPMVPTSFELPYSIALLSEFNELAPPPDLAMLPGSAGPSLSTPLLNPESAPLSDDTPGPEQAHRLTAFIGVVLLTGGLILYLRSETFLDWLHQFLFDAFSPLKYD